MTISRRTQAEIRNDYQKLKEAINTCTTIRNLENLTGLSYSMIKTTLQKNGVTLEQVKTQLSANRKQKQPKKVETAQNQNSKIKTSKIFVIDASITGIKNLQDMILNLCLSNHKIILTSITINELEKLQQYKDSAGLDARYILFLAAENDINFETVLIDESLSTPDDCIIKYCADHKDDVILLTSDKTMALKARMYSIRVNFFRKTALSTTIRTLIPANKVGNNLVISNFQTSTMSIRIFSNGIEYNDGVKQLQIGDDVFISTRKHDYITFAHYKMISLCAENNCKLIYSHRLYDTDSIDIRNSIYLNFIKDFKSSHNL